MCSKLTVSIIILVHWTLELEWYTDGTSGKLTTYGWELPRNIPTGGNFRIPRQKAKAKTKGQDRRPRPKPKNLDFSTTCWHS